MEKQKRYTPAEMRDMAHAVWSEAEYEDYNVTYRRPESGVGRFRPSTVDSMLRQAADAEDELVKVKASKERWMQYQETAAGERNACIDELRKKDAEIAELRTRLAEVVKECEKQIPVCRGEDCKCNPTDAGYCDENCHAEIIVNTAVTAILRAARGEGSPSRQT